MSLIEFFSLKACGFQDFCDIGNMRSLEKQYTWEAVHVACTQKPAGVALYPCVSRRTPHTREQLCARGETFVFIFKPQWFWMKHSLTEKGCSEMPGSLGFIANFSENSGAVCLLPERCP